MDCEKSTLKTDTARTDPQLAAADTDAVAIVEPKPDIWTAIRQGINKKRASVIWDRPELCHFQRPLLLLLWKLLLLLLSLSLIVGGGEF